MEKLLLISLLLKYFVSVSSYNVPAIFSFGDSILDAGNNHFNKNCTIQADFPPYGSSFFHYPTGRFTNGRTVVDFLSQFLGIELQKPYLQLEKEIFNGHYKNYPSNGINFASAGSGVLQETNKDSGVTPIQDQLKQFQTLMKLNKIDKKLVGQSLFLFESGSNDIFNYFIPSDPPLNPNAFVHAMLTQFRHLIDQIYKLGARRIAVIALGPVGCIPARATLPRAPINRCYGKMNLMVKKYNSGLESLVTKMNVQYHGAVVAYGATYNVVQRYRKFPKHHGFSNASSACCGDGTLGGMLQCGKKGFKICENPNEFLFWDHFHPSEHTYKLIAKGLWGGSQNQIRPLNLKTMAHITLTYP